MSLKILVLLNAKAGTLAGMELGETRRRIAGGFANAGADAEVRFVEPDRLEHAAREANRLDIDAIIAGGGDGTINTIANAVAEGDKAFGVLPLGTFNHFAREFRIPLELDEATAVLAKGKIEEIDIAEVNGKAFLNFSAIGIHPQAVEERDRPSLMRRLSKTGAMVLALAKVVMRLPIFHLRLSTADQSVVRRTPSLVVCNNVFQMRAFGVEGASVPDRGLLNVYIADSPKSRNVLWLIVQAVLGLLRRRTKHFTAVALPELRVEAPRWWGRSMRISVDGELMTLRLPLHYRIRPRPLRVLVPA